ncbi:MAG: hypothetical protein RL391_714 [Actinomycetota bacterium]|jgi:uncharacterized protein (TIGR03083 family)
MTDDDATLERVSHLLSDEKVVEAYIDLRHRVIVLLRSLSPEQSRLVVPACPEWTVSELAAHIVGTPEDILAGRMEGVTTDAWTQAQVDRHRGESTGEIADRLAAIATEFDVVLPHIPSPVNSQMVMDAVTHELDLRSAVGNTDARESLALEVARGWLLDSASRKNPDFARKITDLSIDTYDLVRSLTGRRTSSQIAEVGLDERAIAQLLEGSPLHLPTSPVE